MKKFLAGLLMTCMMVTSICTSAFATSTGTDATAASASETVAETQAEAVILDTDEVSTEDIALYSKACVVMDADTGQVLYYKNPGDRHYPASITKVLTSLLLIENAQLTDQITFTQDCWEGIDIWSDMNVAMEDDEILTAEQALYCMLLVSANEVCNQVGIHVSGSIAGFADLMNQRAEELGCTGSHFVTTNGLHDDNHYTTAHDMALIARAAIQNETFRTVTGTTYYKVTTNKRPEGFELYHKHRMLMATSYHDDRCIGGKTGYTPQANNTLITYMQDGDITLACVVLDNNNGHIYSDTADVCEYCFSHYTRESIDELSKTEEGEAMNAAGAGEAVVETEAESQDLSSADAAQADDDSLNQTGDGSDSALAESSDDNNESLSKNSFNITDTIANIKANIKEFSSSPSDYCKALRDKAITTFIKYIPYSFVALIIVFLILSLILIWLRGVIHRGIHRRRYKKLKKNRGNRRKSKNTSGRKAANNSSGNKASDNPSGNESSDK